MSRCIAGCYFYRLLASRRCWPPWAPGVELNGLVEFLSGEGKEGHLFSSCSQDIFLELESRVVCLSSRPGPSWSQGLPSPSSCGQGLGATSPQQLSWVKGLLPHNSCPRPGSEAVLPSWLPWTTLGSEAVLSSSCFGPGWGEGMTWHH